MAPTKFLNFLAVVTFAVFCISLTPISANAVAVERAHIARSPNYAHGGIARKKRGGSAKRCKPRPTESTHTHSSKPHHHHTTSSSSVTTSHTPTPTPKAKEHHAPPPPPATSSSSSTHAPAVTPNSSSGAGVVGLAWSNSEQSAICKFKTSHTGLVYNWKLNKYGDVDVSKCGFEFMPQVWGAKDVGQVSETLVAGYAKRVLSFNEPDQGGQSNLGVDEAVSLHMKYIDVLKHRGYEIISPACTNSPDGVAWITDFVKKVRQQGGQLDAIATHYYSTSSSDFINFMDHFMGLFPGDRIYLTEFAAQDYSGKNQQLNFGQIQAFLETTTSYMRGKPQIAAYFYFAPMTQSEIAANNVNVFNALMNDDHSPSQLGQMYLNP